MGCGASFASRKLHYVVTTEGERRALKMMHSLGFNEESIDILYSLYEDIDVSGDHSVSAIEFFAHFSIEPTNYWKDIFSVMDFDGSGELSFLEFACSLWNFLSTDEKTLGGFIYLLCPQTKGIVDPDAAVVKEEIYVGVLDMEAALRRIHSKRKDNSEKKAFDDVMTLFRSTFRNGVVQVKRFQIFCYENPHLLAPLVKVQLQLQTFIIDAKFWKDMVAFRHDHPEIASYDQPYRIRNRLLKWETADAARQLDLNRKRDFDEKRSGKPKGGERTRRRYTAGKAIEHLMGNSATDTVKEKKQKLARRAGDIVGEGRDTLFQKKMAVAKNLFNDN
jgi:hypothetical protein